MDNTLSLSHPSLQHRWAFARSVSLYWVLFAAVLGIGVALRLDALSQPMRYDEAYTTVWFVAPGLPTIVSDYTVPNNHILHTLLVWVSTSLFGFSAATIRLPALLAGVACIPLMLLVGTRLFNRNVGLLAAALVAGASVLVEYSTNARGYTLQCLLVLLLLAQATRLRDTGQALSAWRVYIALSVAGLYVIPTMLLPLAGIAFWLFASAWRHDRATRLRAWLALAFAHVYIVLLAGVLYLPVLIYYGVGAIFSNRFVVPREAADVWHNLTSVFTEWLGLLARGLPLPLLALLTIGVGVAAYAWCKRRDATLGLLICCFGVAVVYSVVQRNAGFARTWIYLMPLLYLVSAWGLNAVLARFRWGNAVVVTALLLAVLSAGNTPLLTSTEGGTCPNARETAAAIERGEPVDGSQVALPCDAPVDYYRWVDGKRAVR